MMVFAANNADGTVVQIDAQDGRVVGLVPVGHAPTDVASWDGFVWVSIQSEALCDRGRDRDLAGDDPALTSSISALSERGTRALIVPRPTPRFRREKREVRPVSSVPRASSSIVSNTATSSLFTALVSMCWPRWDWSTSTPIPQIPRSLAASSAPRPQARRPGTRLAIPSRSGSGRPTYLSGSRKSSVWLFNVVTRGLAPRAPAW